MLLLLLPRKRRRRGGGGCCCFVVERRGSGGRVGGGRGDGGEEGGSILEEVEGCLLAPSLQVKLAFTVSVHEVTLQGCPRLNIARCTHHIECLYE